MHYPVALSKGTIVGDDYRIEGTLGSGGTGITYVATEIPLERKVAIKEYFPSDLAIREDTYSVSAKTKSDEEDYNWGLDRFIEEAQTLAKFDHTNIVRVFRYFKKNNTAYMVLKFEEGQDFKTWFSELGRPPTQTELEIILTPLLDALKLIHDNSFLHRDISPDNIIIRKNGSPVLIDFGSARKFIMNRSKTVSALVKPGYSPYEQYAMNAKNQGPWTDIYSMGATLYHAATGQRPTDSPSRMVEDELSSAIDIAPKHFKTNFLKAIDHALKLRIEDRPKSIEGWREQLFSIDKTHKVDTPEVKENNDNLEVDFSLPDVFSAPIFQFKIIKRIRRQLRRYLIRFLAYYAHFDKNRNLKKAESLLERLDDIPKKKAEEKSLEELISKKQKAKPAPKKHIPILDDEDDEPETDKPKNFIPQFVTMKLKRDDLPVKMGPTTEVRARIRTKQSQEKNKKLFNFSKLSLSIMALKACFIIAIVFTIVTFLDFEKGNQLASTSENDTLVKILNDHNGSVNQALYSSNGDHIISASDDKTIKIWDSYSGELQTTLYGHYSPIVSVHILQSFLVSADSSGKIILWSLKNFKKVKTLESKNPNLKAVYFSGSFYNLLLVHNDRILFIDHKEKFKRRYRILSGRIKISATDFSPRRNIIAAIGSDQSLKLWRTRNGSLLRSYNIKPQFANGVSFSADSRRLAVISQGDLHIWSARSRKKIRQLSTGQSKISSVAFSPNGRFLATAGRDNSIKIWNWRTGKLLKDFKAQQSFINHIAFSPDSRRLLSSGKDRTLKLWNIQNIE